MRSFEIQAASGRAVRFCIDKPAAFVFRDIMGQGKPETAVFTSDTLYGHGARYTGALLQGRELTVRGYVAGDTREAMDEALGWLNACLSPGEGEATLLYQNAHGRYRAKGLAGDALDYGARMQVSGRHYTPVTMAFVCTDPAWGAIEVARSDLAYFDGLFAFPFEVPAAFGGSGYRQMLVNAGDLPSPVTIRLTGPAKLPSVINATSGESLSLTRSLERYEALHISTDPAAPTVELENTIAQKRQDAFSYIDITTPTHAFWLMRPGANEVHYKTGDESRTARMQITWQSLFSGV